MKTLGLRDTYDRDGFLLIPRVLSPDEVVEMRRLLDREFERVGAIDYLMVSQTLEVPALWKTMFLQPIIGALKAVLGDDFTLFPNVNVQKNQFGDYRLLHHDSDSEGRQAYLSSPDYRFLKCGIYLQDNLREWGGGILVTPGKHHFPLVTGIPRLDFRLKWMRDFVAMKQTQRWLDIKAGDIVLFDSRLPHASAFPSRYSMDQMVNSHLHALPAERTKYVIYWDACSTRPYALDFMKNSARRAAYEMAFCSYMRLRYPEDYPAGFVAAAKKEGVHIAHLSNDEAVHFQKEWEQKFNSGSPGARP